jgi:VIT1/CCC1 family predicted Fe2+/Mn2+ transporter
LSIATAGQEEVRTVLAAAIGCNLAWGLVDAVMYIVRGATERTRNRTLAPAGETRAVVSLRDLVEAFGVFLLVVIATFPVVVPFLLIDDARTAMRVAQVVTLVMLFLAGFALGRHAGYAKPLRAGLGMAVFGAVLIAVVKALGG